MFYFQKIDDNQVYLRMNTQEGLRKEVERYFDQLTEKHGQEYATEFFKTMECIEGD